MSKTLADKKIFIENHLLALLRKADDNILGTSFIEKSSREIVLVEYKNGYVKRVDVTGASYLGIIADVVNALVNL